MKVDCGQASTKKSSTPTAVKIRIKTIKISCILGRNIMSLAEGQWEEQIVSLPVFKCVCPNYDSQVEHGVKISLTLPRLVAYSYAILHKYVHVSLFKLPKFWLVISNQPL